MSRPRLEPTDDLLKIGKKISERVGVPVEFVMYSGWQEVRPKKDVVRVLLMARPDGMEVDEYNRNWQLYLDDRDDDDCLTSRDYTVLGMIGHDDGFDEYIADAEGEKVFGRLGNDYFFLYDFENFTDFAEYVEFHSDKFRYIAVKQLDKELLKGLLVRATGDIRKLEDNLKKLDYDIQTRLDNLSRVYIERRELLEKLNFSKFNDDAINKKVDQQLKELKNVTFDGRFLVFKTEDITIQSLDEKLRPTTYELGKFTIKLDTDYWKFAFVSDKGMVGGFSHPHINGTNPCFGAIGSEVVKLIHAGEFGILYQILVSYLNSYNPFDAYIHLLYFKPENYNKPISFTRAIPSSLEEAFRSGSWIISNPMNVSTPGAGIGELAHAADQLSNDGSRVL